MNATESILESIERRIDETNAEIALLKAARAALVTDAGAVATPSDRGRRATAIRTRGATGRALGRAAAGTVTEPARNGGSKREARAAQPSAAAEPPMTGEPPAAAQPPAAPESPPAPAAPAASKPRVARRRQSARRSNVVPAGKLEVLLAATDGMSTGALAEQTGGRAPQVLTLLRELERGGKVRRTGERRGTRWHWITDEERIQARVAELERLAK